MKRSTEALWRAAPGFLAVTRPGGEVLTIDGPAPDIWELLADDIEFDQLAVELATRYGAPLELVRADLTAMLDRLIAEGLVDP